MRALAPIAAALLLAASCVPSATLKPTLEAQTLQNNQDTAVTEVAGVKLMADGSAWKGSPSDLSDTLTPVYVRIDNHSGRTLRIRYSEFALVGAQSGFRYSALSPLSLRQGYASVEPSSLEEGTGGSGHVSVGVGVVPAYGPRYYGHGRGFYGRGFYGGGGWTGPYFGPYPYYGPYYYGYGPYGGYPYYEEPLPTRDMLQRALPEGTLPDGGTVQGFVYFQGIAHREPGVRLQAQLVDANSGETLGTLDIPFQVHKG
ncbi:hypothetical protein LZ198_41180 [Myxococcus sp. K15C18031901]|uniref:hypothetical protein n=1 Tax=Myxococcus dinghuensis TaxID=2906761 RepID=UPI0020A795A5|nr:hypothetical protein [Myxococcus dinghuensis]MCP3105301.1 hypothetical protein [Myxococcus dinghuensis]